MAGPCKLMRGNLHPFAVYMNSDELNETAFFVYNDSEGQIDMATWGEVTGGDVTPLDKCLECGVVAPPVPPWFFTYIQRIGSDLAWRDEVKVTVQ